MMDVSDLTRDPKNARRRSERATAVLAGSVKRFGAARSVVVDADGKILAGNGTVDACEAAGITKVRIIEGKPDELVVVQRSDLEGEAAAAYAIADNRTSELAEWDLDELGGQLKGLVDFTPDDLGFGADDLKELFPVGEPPEDFPEIGENIETEHECPKCGYRYSGGKESALSDSVDGRD